MACSPAVGLGARRKSPRRVPGFVPELASSPRNDAGVGKPRAAAGSAVRRRGRGHGRSGETLRRLRAAWGPAQPRSSSSAAPCSGPQSPPTIPFPGPLRSRKGPRGPPEMEGRATHSAILAAVSPQLISHKAESRFNTPIAAPFPRTSVNSPREGPGAVLCPAAPPDPGTALGSPAWPQSPAIVLGGPSYQAEA